VPFGKRSLSGIGGELAGQADVAHTKPIHELHETFVSRQLLELAGWIASYYGCTRGEALQSVLPPSLRRTKLRARPTGIARVTNEALRQGGEGSEAYVAAQSKLARAKRQLALLTELLSSGGDAPVPVILEEWGYAREVLDGLVARGIIAIEAIEKISPLDALESRVESLTAAQNDALAGDRRCARFASVSSHFDPRRHGSGKTEVYLRAARRVLDDDGGCIVLVPEIGLLPQATARYRRAFGGEVAIIHSRLTGPDRFDIWERIERGEHRVVVGPRSAVFSPVKNLRLIIVDEEQDDSYKQDDKPRYHARSVAWSVAVTRILPFCSARRRRRRRACATRTRRSTRSHGCPNAWAVECFPSSRSSICERRARAGRFFRRGFSTGWSGR
jgi:primosomal protein N' (replication factor Y)